MINQKNQRIRDKSNELSASPRYELADARAEALASAHAFAISYAPTAAGLDRDAFNFVATLLTDSTAGLDSTTALTLRNEALFALVETMPGGTTAVDIEAELVRYVGAAWPHDRHLEGPPDDADTRRVALYRFTRLNGGAPLMRRQIRNVLAEKLSP